MNIKPSIFLLFAFLLVSGAKAQITNIDSATAAKTLAQLASICKNVDFGDPKVTELGTFYTAAPFIVYRGEDENRNWKDFADYSNPKEKIGVDEVCFHINQTINQDENYKIVGYRSDTESEGTWYVLMVSFIKKNVEKKAEFAFLKIKGRFALGDIDNQ